MNSKDDLKSANRYEKVIYNTGRIIGYIIVIQLAYFSCRPLVHWSVGFITNHRRLSAWLLSVFAFLAGFILAGWKAAYPLSYGIIEVSFGLVLCFNNLAQLPPHFELAKMLTIFSALYVVSRGIYNIGEYRDKQQLANP